MAKAKKAQGPHHVRLRKNDLVEVIAGREKGKTGKILRVLRDKNQVVIEKVNLIKRHTRPSPTTGQGGIVEKEAPLNVAKVKLV
ncbi:MAG TPA: 50S ribosomal protein L24, partial [Desulfobaccales bacterium]|nr:50S ribosomal protein L24 [Desulfobaccales bacterium]